MKKFLIIFSKIISSIFTPVLIPVYTFTLLIFSQKEFTTTKKISLYIVAILFSSVLHIIPIVYLKLKGEIKSLDIVSKEKRIMPLSFSILIYTIGYFLMNWMNASDISQVLMLGYIIITTIVIIITYWWKISIHALGISGPLVILNYYFGAIVLPFYILIPIVCVSRVILKRHTIKQVIVGAGLGIGMSVLILLVYFS